MLKSVCKTCPAAKAYEPSEWYHHIWWLYSLKRGGYPFDKDDLSIEEWIDMGVLTEHLDSMKMGLKYHG